MNSNCVHDMIRRIESGESAENVIPIDCSGMSESQFIECCMIYIKYGSDPERIRVCRSKLNACRSES